MNKKIFVIFVMLILAISLISASASFAADSKVKTKLTVHNITSKYSEKTKILVELVDDKGNPLEGEAVRIVEDGWSGDPYYTDSLGQISINAETSMEGTWYNYGRYLVTASYNGSSKYASSSGKGYIIVKSMPVNLTLDIEETNSKQYAKIKLTDAYNKPVESLRVNVYVDGKFHTYVLTSSKGKVYFDLSKLPPGKHNITFSNSEVNKNYIVDKESIVLKIKDKGQGAFDSNNSNNSSSSKNNNLKAVAFNMKDTGLQIGVILAIIGLISSIFVYKRN
ncbi:hypothetical protein [Methanobrevibacter filiformis]|uniref:Bacterial Ig-like domain protein n=1 Tax=Methanobrevibacter filiformis TaxID=55758 RepID=A0A166FBD2_9EURY|nr:hypothetical protein [Methanobrevibacter filiformis]KZX17495.1 bacterial Ig-like domain protein [Methanobrevibacter filiformis]